MEHVKKLKIEAIEITEMIHPISLHLQFWNWNAKRGGYFWNWTTGWITIFDLSLLLFEYKFEIGVLTDGMKRRNYVRSYLRMFYQGMQIVKIQNDNFFFVYYSSILIHNLPIIKFFHI